MVYRLERGRFVSSVLRRESCFLGQYYKFKGVLFQICRMNSICTLSFLTTTHFKINIQPTRRCIDPSVEAFVSSVLFWFQNHFAEFKWVPFFKLAG